MDGNSLPGTQDKVMEEKFHNDSVSWKAKTSLLAQEVPKPQITEGHENILGEVFLEPWSIMFYHHSWW